MADGPLLAVLAAGRGRRFGGGKLEARCAGKPLGRWVLDAVAAAGLPPGVIVTGPEGVSFAAEWTALVNPDPAAGLGSSLAVAAGHALKRRVGAMLVLLADMPLVSVDYLRLLAGSAAPAATKYPDCRAGVPALLDAGMLEVAAGLSGDRGMGGLLANALLLDPPAVLLADVDDPDDLARVERVLWAKHASS